MNGSAARKLLVDTDVENGNAFGSVVPRDAINTYTPFSSESVRVKTAYNQQFPRSVAELLAAKDSSDSARAPATALPHQPSPNQAAPNPSARERLAGLVEEAAIIEKILLEVDDLSLLSPRLLARAIELGVWYHFNPCRTNPVRMLELPEQARVLEVGCGAGVVTRFLGEQGFSVVAVESCEELSRCAQLRCHGLRNVEVVNGYLQDVMTDERFDLVVCLDPDIVESEYGDGVVELFALCRKLLRPGGTMVAAVGNTISSPAETHISLTKDHVRGRGATLGSLRDALTSAGFAEHQTLLTFPQHATPHLLVEPMASRSNRTEWLQEVEELYSGTDAGVQQLLRWWKTIRGEYLDSALAPGWVFVAHVQQPRARFWSGWSVARCGFTRRNGAAAVSTGVRDAPFTLSAAEASAESDSQQPQADADGAKAGSIVPSVTDLIEQIVRISRPFVKAVVDFDSEIQQGIDRIKLLSQERLRLRTKFAQKRLASREQLHSERRGRKAREAELDLVLEHSRTVGALWGELKREKQALRHQVEELSARCEATQQCMLELVDKVLVTEAEVVQLRRSWRGRIKDWFLSRFWGRRPPLQLQRTVTESV